ncbi:hypothetical protein [Armatimonas rosea]|uniref:Uncharacterized protein n=1 Tax=Armatimonas rosea TaxID=685828 RepID=A0A7W9W8X2_ARMRO|nr:hypothetical protein [Armatimonas rosea]MBB6053208.1 hypothetical protein [Armatimonas rosea]
MTAAVSAALEALYTAFADAPRPTVIPHSPLKQLDTAPLLTKPLRALTDEDLSDYHFGVFNTITEDSFAYFLPRLVELTHDETSVLCTELIYQKVAQDGWQHWPMPRREAFQSYLDAVVASFAEEAQWDTADRVCGLGSLLDDLPERLNILLQDTAAACANLLTLHENDGGNSFWDKRSAGYTRYVAWLHSDAVFQRVLEIYSTRQ